MLSIGGQPSRACCGVSRRAMLQAAGAGLLRLSLPKVLAAEAQGLGGAARAKSVIFLFLFGGPSQYETLDMKPEASSDIRGPFRPIGGRTPGLRICEHLPNLANVSDKFCVLRAMSHDFNDHSGGGHFDQQRRLLDERDASQLDALRQRALGLAASSKTRIALDVRREPPALRQRYGRHLFGQATLLARRLVEAGVRFVTVHYDACDGYSWDSHVHSRDVKDHLLPTLDQALSALLLDLDDRGLLSETLVVALGEMGRTAKPTPDWGRGHWSTLFPAVIAGGGVRGGTTFGASDKDGQYPIEDRTSPEDLAATIYHALGIDPAQHLSLPDGRPVPLVSQGRPLREIFA